MDVLNARNFEAAGAPEYRAPAPVLNPGDIRRFLGRRRWAIAIPLVLALAGAVTYLQTAESIYTAKAQIIIDPRLPQFIPGRSSDSVMAWDSAQVESEIAVLTSDKIASLVVSALKLTESEDFRPRQTLLGTFLERVLPQAPVTDIDRRQEAIGLIEYGLSVRRTGLSYAIDIAFSYYDPVVAQKIANAIADAYIADQLQTRAEAARIGGEWLQQRMVSLRAQMNNAAQEAQAFRASHDYRLPQATAQKPPAKPEDDGSGGGDANAEKSLEELDAAAATYRRIYESFLQSYTESVQRQSFPVSDAHLLTSASLPLSRSAPKALLIYPLALLLGALIGFGTALVRDNFDRTVRTARHVSEVTTLEWLGTIPLVRRRPFRAFLARVLTVLGRSRKGAVARVCSLDVTQLQGLRWRRFRHRLYFRAIADGRHRPFCQGVVTVKTHLDCVARRKRLGCIGVTAAARGAGASTLASNLAVLGASYGEKVLLIDADIWSASLSRNLQVVPNASLSDVITGTRAVEDAAVEITADKGLMMLGTSRARDGSSGKTIRDLEVVIRRALEIYDTVLIDLPPVLPAAEVLAISPLLDGVVLAVEEGWTTIDDVTAMASNLERAQARVLGFVLTKASL